MALPSTSKGADWGKQESLLKDLPYHGGRHTGVYNNRVEDLLYELQQDYNDSGGAMTDFEVSARLNQISTQIRTELDNDTLRLQRDGTDIRPRK